MMDANDEFFGSPASDPEPSSPESSAESSPAESSSPDAPPAPRRAAPRARSRPAGEWSAPRTQQSAQRVAPALGDAADLGDLALGGLGLDDSTHDSIHGDEEGLGGADLGGTQPSSAGSGAEQSIASRALTSTPPGMPTGAAAGPAVGRTKKKRPQAKQGAAAAAPEKAVPARRKHASLICDRDLDSMPLEAAAALVWERLRKNPTPRGVSGGSDHLDVFRSLDAQEGGRLPAELMLQALSRLGLKASSKFLDRVRGADRANESDEWLPQATSALFSKFPSQVDYADFVDAVKRLRPRPFGFFKSSVSGLVLEMGAGDSGVRALLLMPRDESNPNQHWRLTADGYIECLAGAELTVLGDRRCVLGIEGFVDKFSDKFNQKQPQKNSKFVVCSPRLCAPEPPVTEGAAREDGKGQLNQAATAAAEEELLKERRALEFAALAELPTGAQQAQRWRYNARFEIFSRASAGMFLTVKGGNKTVDAQVWVNSCKKSNAQKWTFEPLDDHDEKPTPRGGGPLKSFASQDSSSQDSTTGGDQDDDSTSPFHNPLMGSKF